MSAYPDRGRKELQRPGTGQPVVCIHGWPLISADDRDAQIDVSGFQGVASPRGVKISTDDDNVL